MKKLICLIVVIFLLSLSFTSGIVADESILQKTIYVDDNNTEGPWDGTQEHPYQFIQDGINNASNGDTIYVFNGVYTETIQISKSLILTSENKNDTILQAGYGENIIFIHADAVVIESFTFRPTNNDSSFEVRAIVCEESRDVIIRDNYIFNCRDGIKIKEESYTEIYDNLIHYYPTERNLRRIAISCSEASVNISENTIIDYHKPINIGLNTFYPKSFHIDHNNLVLISQFTGIKRGISIDYFNINSDSISDYDEGLYVNITHNNIKGFGEGITIAGDPSYYDSSVNYPSVFISRNSIESIENDFFIAPSFSTITIVENNILSDDNSWLYYNYFILYILFLGYRPVIKNDMIWDSNYWQKYDDSNSVTIPGKCGFIYRNLGVIFTVPIYFIDWNPAQEPYDIPAGGVE